VRDQVSHPYKSIVDIWWSQNVRFLTFCYERANHFPYFGENIAISSVSLRLYLR
jgi:hypothetical protein